MSLKQNSPSRHGNAVRFICRNTHRELHWKDNGKVTLALRACLHGRRGGLLSLAIVIAVTGYLAGDSQTFDDAENPERGQRVSVNTDRTAPGQPRLITREEMESLADSVMSQIQSEEGRSQDKEASATASEMAARLRRQHAVAAKQSESFDEWVKQPPTLSQKEMELLVAAIRWIEARSTQDVQFAVDTMSIYQIRSAALEELFHGIAFVDIAAVMIPRQEIQRLFATTRADVTVGLDGQRDKVWYFHLADHREFGRLLCDRRIVISNEQNAALVWQAFCAVHGLRMSSGEHRKVGDHTWWLNWERKENRGFGIFEYYYEVVTDEEGRVLRGESKSRQVARAERVQATEDSGEKKESNP